ncbi:metal ABC transporter ATP-binding protein [Clostridium manihotivorum]|uniref:Zinc ABC transporter ATP-binding protein n=1 Tax=Clostridium manihotivorum TaxID=2320868 RepID=A0A410DPK8_9CLOT|nr:metal ABC transporter ATP-binding protein [Clostridium manihotivorum]QAA30988.1 zinc ABC transporter ATP-binding protein [Clostridium manihotivorum]
MNEVVNIKDLSFSYGALPILKNISFKVNKGEFIGIIGANGEGKSTLMKLLTRSLIANTGEIQILGEKLEAFNAWDRVGYLSQKATSFNLSFPATVGEVVGANLYKKIGLFKRANKNHKGMVAEALDKVGMAGYEDRMIGALSGGQQQRVFIARMLVNEPEILLLDEPTVGVDAKSQEIILSLVKKFNRENGITVMIISHDMKAIDEYCNRVLILKDGRLKQRFEYDNIGLEGKEEQSVDYSSDGIVIKTYLRTEKDIC